MSNKSSLPIFDDTNTLMKEGKKFFELSVVASACGQTAQALQTYLKKIPHNNMCRDVIHGRSVTLVSETDLDLLKVRFGDVIDRILANISNSSKELIVSYSDQNDQSMVVFNKLEALMIRSEERYERMFNKTTEMVDKNTEMVDKAMAIVDKTVTQNSQLVEQVQKLVEMIKHGKSENPDSGLGYSEDDFIQVRAQIAEWLKNDPGITPETLDKMARNQLEQGFLERHQS